MPGLRNRNNEYSHLLDNGIKEPYVTRAPSNTPAKATTVQTMAHLIKFIPPQMDALAGTTTEASRNNPLRLLMKDFSVLLKMLPLLPLALLPVKVSKPSADIYSVLITIRDYFLNGWLIILESTFMFLAVPAMFILPGSLSLAVGALYALAIIILAWPLHGERIAYSKMDERTTAMAKRHESERWLFVNGIMTGNTGLQQNIDRLSETFGRAVIGIHNQSYGLLADLVECLVQRSLSYNTKDVRLTYDYVKACLVDASVTKVVLVGHSQGGIVVSLVLDQLFADIPTSNFSKLEVYTFGSAASHFNNPRFSLSPASPPCIPHIEHYCNEKDMVPRWGVLYNTTTVLDNRYSGTVFVRKDTTGHLFNQHYMDPMFPLCLVAQSSSEPKDSKAINIATEPNLFLDEVVEVDETTAARRENTAIRNIGLMRQESGVEFGDGGTVPVGIISNRGAVGDGEPGFGFVEVDGSVVFGLGREARGKTVRELSHLWTYIGGASPPSDHRDES